MNKRKGFSLVELLVVIVIMGILGAGVMLSSGGAVASARALTIINDLRSLKEAALLFYLDNPDTAPTIDALKTYIDNSDKLTGENIPYSVEQNNAKDTYFIGYSLKNVPNKTAVQNSLQSRAKSAGLYSSIAADTTNPKWARMRYPLTLMKL